MAKFSNGDLRAIAQVLGHPEHGLTTSDLQSIFQRFGIAAQHSWTDKPETIYQALREPHVMKGHPESVWDFLQASMRRDFHRDNPEQYARLRALLNDQLLLCGLRLDGGRDFSEAPGLC
jgi:hypothetical protein